MRRVFTIAAAMAITVCLAGNALAVIGWAGNVWPLHNSDHLPTGPIDVYAQVWKDGVTPDPGQGAGITAELFYTPEGGATQSAPMVYNTDVGANDEYTGQVPQAALLGVSYVDVTVIFTDTTDMTTFEITGDQQGNPPPLRYNVSDALPNDIEVTFTMCMSGTATAGPPCVIGSAPEIGSWGTGVNMNPEGSHADLWTVDVTFFAGGNPSFEYKYKKDACVNWEGTGNRAVTLPTDGTTSVVLPIDSWEFQPMGCDIGETLTEDKVVCFQVCLEGVTYTPDVCVTGGHDLLTNWGDGVVMIPLGTDLFQVCIIFPAGMTVQDVEYKFKKDACQTWESVPNRVVTVDNSSPPEQTVTHAWDDGPSTCQPIATENSSWGAVKGLYK